ncbi:MAG: alanine--tRNA ligase [Bacteroidota bacterium]
MHANSIREKFISFFQQKGHQHVAAAPIVQPGEPSLLFTNAGMNQFREFFLAPQRAPYQRTASSQPCLRVSGKHNDLEAVGTDTYHHTMFEMLGNWSFSDYFKQEAISWAWELLTASYQLSPTRLYVTVFGGDTAEHLAADQEAYELWKQLIPEERILYGSKKDNFWEMGQTGPCGPSTEIHIDLRPEEARQRQDGKDLVNTGHPQVIELWNLVFIQYNRLASGQLVALAAKHVDTGMGLERLAMVLQGKESTYDTDLFRPLIQAISQASHQLYGQEATVNIAMQVVADHSRAVTFAIADGQVPTNTQAGYVVRRLLRRAVRYGYTYLGFEQPFMYQLVAVLAQQFSTAYPGIQQQQAHIAQVIRSEEVAFGKTLATGLRRLSHIIQGLQAEDQQLIDGHTAFELYDTYGFPLDLTRLIAQEKGLQVDESGFNQALQAQRTRARQAAATTSGDWHIICQAAKPAFVGYDQLQATTKIVQYRAIQENGQQLYQLVLAQTPFCPASGGQVGDTGKLTSGAETIAVLDTQQEHGLIIHYTQQLPQDPQAPWQAIVDAERRESITSHHSATHLLHAALKQVLGPHVVQRGSLVSEHGLRFDFSHHARVSPEDLRQIERLVNQKIRANIPLQEQRQVPLAAAKALGATALFGERYGEHVRVITFDPSFSMELCGGTHVPATGQLGYFKITTETSIAAGTRRVEALAAGAAAHFIDAQMATLGRLRETLNHPKDPVKATQQLVEAKASLSKTVAAYQAEQARSATFRLRQHVQTVQGIHVCIAKTTLPHPVALKQVAFALKQSYEPLFLVLGAAIDQEPHLAVLCTEALYTSQDGLQAHTVVKELAQTIQGSGGGQPSFATARGQNLGGLDQALHRAQDLWQRYLATAWT